MPSEDILANREFAPGHGAAVLRNGFKWGALTGGTLFFSFYSPARSFYSILPRLVFALFSRSFFFFFFSAFARCVRGKFWFLFTRFFPFIGVALAYTAGLDFGALAFGAGEGDKPTTAQKQVAAITSGLFLGARGILDNFIYLFTGLLLYIFGLFG